MHSANGNIERFAQKPTAATAIVYVNADFDTIEKALSSRKMAEKGAETGIPWSITDFGCPVLLYGIVGAAVSVGSQLTLQKRRRGNN